MNTRANIGRDPVVGSGGATPAAEAGSSASENGAPPIGVLSADQYRVPAVPGEGAPEMARGRNDNANTEEPLPSTRPQGPAARMREASRAPAPPAAVAEGDAPRAPRVITRSQPAGGADASFEVPSTGEPTARIPRN